MTGDGGQRLPVKPHRGERELEPAAGGPGAPTQARSRTAAMRNVVIDEDLTMLIGPASDGGLLEIGVLDIDGDDPVVIHVMPLRPKFHRFLK
jgi:hypothetical protein